MEYMAISYRRKKGKRKRCIIPYTLYNYPAGFYDIEILRVGELEWCKSITKNIHSSCKSTTI